MAAEDVSMCSKHPVHLNAIGAVSKQYATIITVTIIICGIIFIFKFLIGYYRKSIHDIIIR